MYVHIRERPSVLLRQCILLIVVRVGQRIHRHWLPTAATFQQSPKLNQHWNYNVCFSIRFQGLKLNTHLLIFAQPIYCTAHVLTYTFTRSLNTF